MWFLITELIIIGKLVNVGLPVDCYINIANTAEHNNRLGRVPARPTATANFIVLQDAAQITCIPSIFFLTQFITVVLLLRVIWL